MGFQGMEHGIPGSWNMGFPGDGAEHGSTEALWNFLEWFWMCLMSFDLFPVSILFTDLAQKTPSASSEPKTALGLNL